MNDQSYQLTEDGKVNYAKSLPYLLNGIMGTIALKPQAQMMVVKIQADPLNSFAQIGGLAKVIPNVPNYIKNRYSHRSDMFVAQQIPPTSADAFGQQGVPVENLQHDRPWAHRAPLMH